MLIPFLGSLKSYLAILLVQLKEKKVAPLLKHAHVHVFIHPIRLPTIYIETRG